MDVKLVLIVEIPSVVNQKESFFVLEQSNKLIDKVESVLCLKDWKKWSWQLIKKIYLFVIKEIKKINIFMVFYLIVASWFIYFSQENENIFRSSFYSMPYAKLILNAIFNFRGDLIVFLLALVILGIIIQSNAFNVDLNKNDYEEVSKYLLEEKIDFIKISAVEKTIKTIEKTKRKKLTFLTIVNSVFYGLYVFSIREFIQDKNIELVVIAVFCLILMGPLIICICVQFYKLNYTFTFIDTVIVQYSLDCYINEKIKENNLTEI